MSSTLGNNETSENLETASQRGVYYSRRAGCQSLHHYRLCFTRRALANRADLPDLLAGCGQQTDCSVRVSSRDDHRHPDTAVEYAMHFRIRHAAVLLQPREE